MNKDLKVPNGFRLWLEEGENLPTFLSEISQVQASHNCCLFYLVTTELHVNLTVDGCSDTDCSDCIMATENWIGDE